MKIGGLSLTFNKPYIVGILNLTPDSFSDGGQFNAVDQALLRAEALIEQGADFIEIGAESTRPFSEPVSFEEERARLEPFLKQYRFFHSFPLILDTRKSETAKLGLDYGVSAINDVSSFLFDPLLLSVVAKASVPAILVHSLGTPETMQLNPSYTNVVEEIKSFFSERLNFVKEAGISDVILDPGIGFGKTLQHNLMILNHLDEFLSLNCPLMVGTSRKSFIGEITSDPVESRLEGTIVSSMLSVLNGAQFLRVHDVLSIKKSLQVLEAIVQV